MEQTGTKDWSDFDSKDGAKRRPFELPKPVIPEAAPERPKSVLDLGVIFDRKDVPPETLQVVSQEHDHVKPEFVQGVTPGTPELAEYRASVPSSPQAAYAAQMDVIRNRAAVEAANDENEDDEEEDSAPPGVVAPSKEESEPSQTPQAFESRSLETPMLPGQESLGRPAVPQMAEVSTAPDSDPDEPAYQPPPPQQPPTPPPAAGGGVNNQPPPPPIQPGNTYPGPQGGGNYNPPPPPSYNRYPNMLIPPTSPNVLMQPSDTFENMQARRRRVAGMILLLALAWYLGRRPVKPLREQVKQLERTTAQQDERISRLTYEQQAAQRRIAEQQRQIEQFTKPQAAPFEQQAAMAFDASQVDTPRQIKEPTAAATTLPLFAGQPAGLEGQGRLEQPGTSAAQPFQLYGAEAGRRPEAFSGPIVDEQRLPAAVPVALPRQGEVNQTANQEQAFSPLGRRRGTFVGGYGGGVPAGGSASPSGQFQAGYSLPPNADELRQETDYSLDTPKRNPIVAAITSPWLWLGVGVLMTAFFVAATI